MPSKKWNNKVSLLQPSFNSRKNKEVICNATKEMHFSSSSFLLPFLTNKTDRPWLSLSSAALVRTATPLMWPKEGAWALFHFATTDSSLCNNLHYYHRWSIIMKYPCEVFQALNPPERNPHLLLEVGSLFTEEEEKRGGLQPPWYV